jgi:hypothetical protein
MNNQKVDVIVSLWESGEETKRITVYEDLSKKSWAEDARKKFRREYKQYKDEAIHMKIRKPVSRGRRTN